MGKIIQFSSSQTVIYQNEVLFFKLGDGTSDSIDFSNASELKKVFESFWDLRRRKVGETLFTPSEVLSVYRELFSNAISRHEFSRNVGNIKRTKIKPKPHLSERFKIKFNNKLQKWEFFLQ